MVKLMDIANRCGLSKAQVSRALSGSKQVSEKTRARVMQAAQEMGYVKNIYASHLVNQSSNQIAVFVQGLESESVENAVNNNIVCLLQGISEYAQENGYEPVISLRNRGSAIDYVSFCRQRLIPGMIVFGCDYDDEEYIQLIKTDFPCVSIDILSEGESKGCVVVNNSFYAQRAVEQLVQAGCQNIALVAGHPHAYVTHERALGYQVALQRAGRERDENLIVYADYDMRIAREKTLELFARRDDIDGIFCMSDQMAIGCLQALKRLKKRVPEDVRLFGFDGNVITRFVDPPLSSIVQDFKQKGYRAAKLLAALVEGSATERTIVVPCQIKVRASSAASQTKKEESGGNEV